MLNDTMYVTKANKGGTEEMADTNVGRKCDLIKRKCEYTVYYLEYLETLHLVASCTAVSDNKTDSGDLYLGRKKQKRQQKASQECEKFLCACRLHYINILLLDSYNNCKWRNERG